MAHDDNAMENRPRTDRLGHILAARLLVSALLHKTLLLAGQVQVLGIIGLPPLILAGILFWRRRRRLTTDHKF